MKKLITLLCAGLITANAFGFETDKYKFIPKGTPVMMYDVDNNGVIDFYWHDRNKDNIIQPEEIFIDLNQDGIPDISYKDIIEMYKNSKRISKESI